jgi:hypothetical protein
VDESGADAFNSLREMRRISNIREQLKGRFHKLVRHSIPLLERWLLKTLINLSYNGDKPIGRLSTIAGKPSDELVKIAFGHSQFAGRAGLYVIGMVGMNMKSTDMFKFAPLVKHNHHIEGALFVFRGHPLLLFLEPEGVLQPLSGLHLEGYDLGHCQVNFHLQRILVSQGKHHSQLLTLNTWGERRQKRGWLDGHPIGRPFASCIFGCMIERQTAKRYPNRLTLYDFKLLNPNKELKRECV